MKKYDILDITKLILSIMVVAIHTELFPMVLYPWLRLAVPLFFVISSFLLYSKINNSPKEEKNKIIKNYIQRLLKLYLFWFICLLPITIYIRREWFSDGLIIGITKVIIKPFVGSTFVASWYIVATILGTLIVDKLSSKLNYKILLPLFVFIYLICCGTSSYSFLLNNIAIPKALFDIYIEPHCSFLVSLIYILFGKMLSENKFKIPNKNNLILIIIFSVLLYLEWYIVYRITGTYNNDCYIFILPVSILIFNYLKEIKIKINNSKLLRQFSNMTYPLHASTSRIVNTVLEMLITNSLIKGILNFIITIIICIIAFIIIKKLEKKYKFLKYAY
ncbi:MAG: acyltransferase family protein [Bacilli bacterium]|nr:acyltransferase family protein [Bacilli bacterium]